MLSHPEESHRPSGSGDLSASRVAADEVHLLDYVRMVYKRRWTAITVFLVIVVSTAIYTFSATPIYEGRVQLMIEAERQNVISFKEVIEQERATLDYYRTQYSILQSRSLARRTLDRSNLWNDPEFAPERGGLNPIRLAGLAWREVRSWFVTENTPENALPGADETAAESRVITTFLRKLRVSPVSNSRLVDLRFEAKDPNVAMRAANSLSSAYIEQNLEFRFTATREASDFLNRQLGEQKKTVETAENALQRYREQNDAIALEDRQNIVTQKLSDLNAAVTRAKTERIQKEAVYTQVRENQDNPALLDSYPAILGNSFIQQLKSELSSLNNQLAQTSERLGDKHPTIIGLQASMKNTQAKLNIEIAKIVQSVRGEYQSALSQEQSLTAALNQQKAEAQSTNRKAIEYGVLERDVQSSKQLYDSLMVRAKETGVSGELKTSTIRVVDAAELPRIPVSPRTQFNLILSLAVGGALAIGVCFFFEYLDNRIKRPDDIKTHLGLAFLGLVPSVSEVEGKDSPLLTGEVPASFAEAFRVVRTNVLFSSAESGAKTLLITSSGPGEGKTVVAANLAAALAHAGQRVVLIDADLRRPRVHSVFGQKQEPGLSNLMVGAVKASEVVVKAPNAPGLWLLPAGRIPPNPAELLGSQRFKEFIASLSDHFDWIIVDSPPVMAVADAAVVSSVVPNVLFVVGAEMVSRYTAVAALDQLKIAHARCIGAVLNRVNIQKNPYYYSTYYRREYTDYYVKTGT